MSEFSVAALRNDVVISDNSHEILDESYYNIVASELLNIGFIVDPRELESLSLNRLSGLIEDARIVAGLDRDYTPMYPGFPESVKNSSTAKLITEQILHYLTNGYFTPHDEAITRDPLPIEDMLKASRKISVKDSTVYADNMVNELPLSKKALSESDLHLLNGAINHSSLTLDDIAHIVEKADNGENIGHLVFHATSVHNVHDIALAVFPRVHNANVLLRVMIVLYGEKRDDSCDDDFLAAVNLYDDKSTSVVFSNASKPVKKLLVHRLGEISSGYKADSLVVKKHLWQRLMRMIHPYDFVRGNDSSQRALDIIHGNIEYKTLNSSVESLISIGAVISVVDLLKNNSPGMILRRLVKLTRISDEDEITHIISALDNMSIDNLSLLISARNGIINVNSDNKIIRIPGMSNSVVDNTNDKIDDAIIRRLVNCLDKMIVNNLRSKPAPIEPVSVDSKDIFPLVSRDSSMTDRAVERGSYIPLEEKGPILRFFQHWINDTENSGYVDLGLTILNDKFDYIINTSWNTWMNNRNFSTYSGDTLVYPGQVAVEFFDINIDKLLEERSTARYIAMTIISYNGTSFKDLDIFSGVMSRTNDTDGELYDYRTVKTAFAPTTDSTLTIPLVFDIEKNEMIWLDSTTGERTTLKTAGTSLKSILLTVKEEMNSNKLTIGDIARLWAEAHNVTTVNEPADKELIMNLL